LRGPQDEAENVMKHLFKKISPDALLIAIVAMGIISFQMKDPYWSVETTTDSCTLHYDGWSWNVNAVSARIGPDLYQRLELTRNGISPYTWSVPRFYASPTEVTIAFEKFWLADAGSYNIATVLAKNEDDEYGSDNTLYNTLKFLKAVKTSPVINIKYINYENRKIEETKIEFKREGSADAIDTFSNCAVII